MMMCSRCKKRPAVVFITSLQGAEKKNEGLCLVCAKELNIPQVDEYMKQMGITEEELEQISNQMMDLMDGENFEMGGSGVLPQFFQIQGIFCLQPKQKSPQNLRAHQTIHQRVKSRDDRCIFFFKQSPISQNPLLRQRVAADI